VSQKKLSVMLKGKGHIDYPSIARKGKEDHQRNARGRGERTSNVCVRGEKRKRRRLKAAKKTEGLLLLSANKEMKRKKK